MESLTLIPKAGLCNRMRAISTAVYLARQWHAPLDIMWNKTKDCAAHFSDLFQPISLPSVSLTDQPGFLYKLHRRSIDRAWIKPLLRLKYTHVLYDFDCATGGDIAHRIAPEGGKVLVKTCYPIAPAYDYNRIFHPSEDIERRIRQITASFPYHTVGVHVRRTDNTTAIQLSPDDYFFRKMDEEVEAQPQTRFYLASDDESVKEKMQARYGQRIIMSNDIPLRRDTVEGMQYAVVELYCLARTQKIIGSGYSSYSDTAADIGHIPLIVPETH